MRIRKRQIPILPFSSSQLSDPAAPHAPPSDSPSLVQDDDTNRDKKVFGAQTSNNGVLPAQSNSTPQVMGQWCEREKAFPLKKRRGSFKKRPISCDNNYEHKDEDQIKTTTRKTMIEIDNKCTLPQDQDQSKPSLNVIVGKKKSRGGALMEGSRCSRVNGRGWRCCQQTLVGYSLCEHHLGKGRLRSMNSVRSRSLAATAPKSVVVENDDEKKPSPPSPSNVTSSKKRMKLGVVKARSISSLLGQPEGGMTAAAAFASTSNTPG